MNFESENLEEGRRLFVVLLFTVHYLLFAAFISCLYSDELLVQQYIKGLNDKKEKVRIESAQKLGDIGKPNVIAPLRDALNDKSTDVRLEVVKALSKIQHDEAVASLAVAVRDKNEKIRLAAVEGLSLRNSKVAIGSLIETTKDKNVSVKKSAINLLGVLEDSSVVPMLSNCLKDKNVNVRFATVYALGSIGGSDAIRALSVGINDKENDVSIAAINVLGAIGDKHSTPLLTAVFRQKRNLAVHNAVMDALVMLGDKSAIPSIVEFMEKIGEEDKGKFRNAIIKILDKNKSVSSKKEAVKIKPVESAATVQKTPSVQQTEDVQSPQIPVQQPVMTRQEKLKIMSQHYSAGVSLYEKRQYEKAIAEWEEVLKLDPNHKQSKEVIEKAKKRMEK